jgi:hypothetical protein
LASRVSMRAPYSFEELADKVRSTGVGSPPTLRWRGIV